MLIRKLISYLYERLVPSLDVVARPISGGEIKLSDIFDGFLLVQKRKKNVRVKWRERFGHDNWKFGTKMWKPRNNLTTCSECGSFYEYHTICRACFEKMNKSSKPNQEQLTESENTQTWFEPNVKQPKNPAANQESIAVIKET